MRVGVIAIVTLVGCGRVGFDPVDAGGASDLCAGTADTNGNGVPDACDPCADPAPPPGCLEVGVAIDGVPSHAEQVWLIALNALRADPIGFRDTYIEFGDSTGAEVFASDSAPRPFVHYRRASNEGGRFHALDRAACDPAVMPELSQLCDGTTYATWSTPYQPIDYFTLYHLGPEAWKAELPIRVFGALTCGGPIRDGTNPVNCPPDVDAPPRLQLLGAWGTGGFGIAYDGEDYTVWDVLLTTDAPGFPYPMPTGGHLIFGAEIHFLLAVEMSAAPAAVFIEIDGVREAMPLGLGTPTRGIHRRVEPTGGGCRSYHFLLVSDDGTIWRYPGTGQLRTIGDAGCTD